MNTTHVAGITSEQRLQSASGRLYDAECALHAARRTHVDAWVTAAGEGLHRALAEHIAALTERDAA